MANKKGSRQLTWTDRISIEALKKAGHSVIEIAEQLGVHRSTIYNELKRGEYMHRNSDYTETLSYSPNKAQMKAEENLKARGTQLKIGNDIAYANYIEDKIVNEDYSPAAVLGELKAQGKEGDFSVTVCVTTLYSYIDKGIFLPLRRSWNGTILRFSRYLLLQRGGYSAKMYNPEFSMNPLPVQNTFLRYAASALLPYHFLPAVSLPD